MRESYSLTPRLSIRDAPAHAPALNKCLFRNMAINKWLRNHHRLQGEAPCGDSSIFFEAPVLHGLGNMRRGNGYPATKIGNGPGNLEYPVKRPR